MFNYNKFSYTIYTINPQIKNSIKKNMTAAFLPAILVPLVGLVFPALSMNGISDLVLDVGGTEQVFAGACLQQGNVGFVTGGCSGFSCHGVVLRLVDKTKLCF